VSKQIDRQLNVLKIDACIPTDKQIEELAVWKSKGDLAVRTSAVTDRQFKLETVRQAYRQTLHFSMHRSIFFLFNLLL
jgi:hypothetical protein